LSVNYPVIPARINREVVLIMEVLIADTDCNNIINVFIALKDYQPDLHLSTVDSGKKCLDMIKTSNQQDMIIVSTELADINGLNLIENIRDNFDTPVILISRNNDPSELLMAMEVGANDFFVKPINKSIFAAKVKAIIRRY
jgi:PleD family two-component response regulator